MECFALKPVSQKVVCMTLFKNVVNSQFLRNQLQDGKLPAALINVNLLVDKLQVLFAATKAAYSIANNQAKTKTFFSEVLFRLSPSNKISDAYRLFGISDDCSCFLLLCEEADYLSISSKVEGDIANLSDLNDIHCKDDVAKSYKLTTKELENNQLLDSVLSCIAVKEIR